MLARPGAGRPRPGDLHTGLRVHRARCASGQTAGGSLETGSYRWVPPAVPAGLPFNVAQLYRRMAEGIRERKSVSPDSDAAVKRHQFLDAIQKASDTGIREIV